MIMCHKMKQISYSHIPLPIITIIVLKHFNQLLPHPYLFEIAVKVILKNLFVTPLYVLVLKYHFPDIFYPLFHIIVIHNYQRKQSKITAMTSFFQPLSIMFFLSACFQWKKSQVRSHLNLLSTEFVYQCHLKVMHNT